LGRISPTTLGGIEILQPHRDARQHVQPLGVLRQSAVWRQDRGGFQQPAGARQFGGASQTDLFERRAEGGANLCGYWVSRHCHSAKQA
jgi:hypothetical protein